MSLDFPNPAQQPVYKAGGITWTWNSTMQGVVFRYWRHCYSKGERWP